MLDIKTVKLRTEQEIIDSWEEKETIVVSVICATYNQEVYIEDAIKGLLMQITDFAFEIIIHDDASTDNTANIILQYKAKYPSIIKTILQDKNFFSLGVRPINFTLPIAKGKYICLCEGDDYWIEPTKVSEQVHFLESNQDCVLHVYDAFEKVSVEAIDLSSSKIQRLNINTDKRVTAKEKKRFALLPLTSCFRNVIEFPLPRYFNKSINGDSLLQLLLSSKGSFFIDDTKKVAVYRLHEAGIWSMQSKRYKTYERLHTHLVLYQYEEDDQKLYKDILLPCINLLGGWKSFIFIVIKKILKISR